MVEWFEFVDGCLSEGPALAAPEEQVDVDCRVDQVFWVSVNLFAFPEVFERPHCFVCFDDSLLNIFFVLHDEVYGGTQVLEGGGEGDVVAIWYYRQTERPNRLTTIEFVIRSYVSRNTSMVNTIDPEDGPKITSFIDKYESIIY